MTKFPDPSKYPKLIYVTNESYKVVFIKKMKDYGETNYDKRIIKLRAGMSNRETFTTFIHEMLHALHHEHGFKLKHKQVYALEKSIFELLVDNFL